MIPRLIGAGIMAWIIRDKSRNAIRRASLRHALSKMPTSFRRYLVVVGLFGAGGMGFGFAALMMALGAIVVLAGKRLEPLRR